MKFYFISCQITNKSDKRLHDKLISREEDEVLFLRQQTSLPTGNKIERSGFFLKSSNCPTFLKIKKSKVNRNTLQELWKEMIDQSSKMMNEKSTDLKNTVTNLNNILTLLKKTIGDI